MKSIVIVAHKYLPQPDDDLVTYLNSKKKSDVTHIYHSIPDAKDRRSYLCEYRKGKMTTNIKSPDYNWLPEPLVLIKNFIYTLVWIFRSNKKVDAYIGMDGFCTCMGLLLKKMGKVNRVIYWSIDFVPQGRFNTAWKNLIYRNINRYSIKKADEVWDLSPRMLDGRKKFLGINKGDYKLHKVVPYGLWLDRINPVPYSKCNKNTVIYMGHLLPKQGVDVFLNKIPEIVKTTPDFKFRIIGTGSYEKNLKDLARKLKVNKYCEFLGRIDDSKEMEKKIAECTVAIAPYKKSKDNYSYFADPGKVKTYLACGVPVLLTDLPWNAGEIQKRRCGLIIKDDGSDLVAKLVKIMNSKVNEEYRKNAAKYSEGFDYNKIFATLDL